VPREEMLKSMEAIPLPNKAQLVEHEGNRYVFVLEPLYPGYGMTVGNAFRRVMLSSMPGAAVTAVKIKWVDHEFSTVPNIKEDVIEIILALKQLRVKLHGNEPVRLTLKKKGDGIATAADITENSQVEIFNKDLHIATLDGKAADLDMEIIVQPGRGYVPVEMRENEKLEIGMIAVDAIYTPIKNVNYDVSSMRVGQLTNFDKLTITLETDGSISGEEAMNISALILVDHFQLLVTDDTVFQKPVIEAAAEDFPPTPEAAALENDIRELNLSARSQNALERNGISNVAQLQAMTVDDIKGLEGLGEKSLKEVLEAIGKNE
jgi:DNA-directed RNA polymerase subunit alpha